MVALKICGLTRPQDAHAAAQAGAVYGGVILAPGSPRTLDPSRAAAVFGETGLVRCGVFVNEPLPTLVATAERLRLGVVQLHGDESPDVVQAVREATGAAVWKAVRPRSAGEFLDAVDAYGGIVEGLLLDGWSAAARGGTGARFPLEEVAPHRDRLPTAAQLIAAGGLTPENVAGVVSRLRPMVVDVSSGVEASPGVKDPVLIARFAAAARGVAADDQGVD